MNATYFDSIKRQLLLISDYIFMAQFFSSLTYDNFYGNYFLCSYCNTMEKKSLTLCLCVSNVSRVCKFFAMSYCSSRYKQTVQITSLFFHHFLLVKQFGINHDLYPWISVIIILCSNCYVFWKSLTCWVQSRSYEKKVQYNVNIILIFCKDFLLVYYNYSKNIQVKQS